MVREGTPRRRSHAEPPIKVRNRDHYRDFFEFDSEIVEFCPKSAILLHEQGSNRDFRNIGVTCKSKPVGKFPSCAIFLGGADRRFRSLTTRGFNKRCCTSSAGGKMISRGATYLKAQHQSAGRSDHTDFESRSGRHGRSGTKDGAVPPVLTCFSCIFPPLHAGLSHTAPPALDVSMGNPDTSALKPL
jgi:hypothetical protein